MGQKGCKSQGQCGAVFQIRHRQWGHDSCYGCLLGSYTLLDLSTVSHGLRRVSSASIPPWGTIDCSLLERDNDHFELCMCWEAHCSPVDSSKSTIIVDPGQTELVSKYKTKNTPNTWIWKRICKEEVVNRGGRLISENDAMIVRIHLVHVRESDINAPCSVELSTVTYTEYTE